MTLTAAPVPPAPAELPKESVSAPVPPLLLVLLVPPLPPPPPTDCAKIPAEFSPVVEINEAIMGLVTLADAAAL